MARVLAWLRHVVTELAAACWGLLALLLDAVGDLGPWGAALVVLTFAASAVMAARLMQRRLVRRIAADPTRRLRFVEQEVWFFLPAWTVIPFVLVARLAVSLWHRLVRRQPAAPSPAALQERPYLAASLGPSFLLGAAVTAIVYLLARLADPLLAARLGLSPGLSGWEFLLLGRRPEMLTHLPLVHNAPYLANVLLFLLWATVWWWAARLVRALFWHRLGGDLEKDRDDPTVLPVWRRWCAVHRLVVPARPYRLWAGSLLTGAVLLAAWAWTSLADAPYRASAADLAAAGVVLLAWGLHLTLAGAERRPASSTETNAVEEPAVAGWPEVQTDLRVRLQVETPLPFRDPRTIVTPELDETDVVADPLLSPLLAELLPSSDGKRRLRTLQLAELHRLSRLGYVFTRQEIPRGELTLGATTGMERYEVRERNRVVLAPEGVGKTTLAILAAVNHALVHTRSSLLVVRDEATAAQLYERIHRLIDRSTLRWNLRLRRVGGDLVADLSRGIVPDLVVTSLAGLVTVVLHQVDGHAPLLGNLGLVVVDDVESFAGTVEIHAQLAFHRLALATRKLVGVDQLGEEAGPLVLALGCETMYQMGTWTGSLLGIDAEIDRFTLTGGDERDGQHRLQEMYRLSDFRAVSGERLCLADLIASCERLGVAWHHRLATDGRRHLGRTSIFLGEEPACFTADPTAAAVVLLEGSWSEVRREIERLALAGNAHAKSPVALIACVDPDVDMALTQRDDRLSLASELTTLPRPVLRPPTGRTIGSHLAADLTQSWTEVADVLRTFGNAAAHKLRELATEGLLLTERRTDIRLTRSEYEEKIYVRALAAAVPEADDERDDGAPLPPRVAQVELTGDDAVEIRDRTDLDLIAAVDAGSAGLAYYPGRIFADARGRFVVVHHAAHEAGDSTAAPPSMLGGRPSAGTILVEPVLGDEISTPRRRLHIETILASGDPSRKLAERAAGPPTDGSPPTLAAREFEPALTGHAFYGPDPLRFGEHPIEVELALLRLRVRHYATHLLGPTFCEVRQRRRFTTGTQHGDGPWETRLTTVALCLYPNPSPSASGDEPPQLRLEEARLVAAAMRAVLPALYRGADEAIGVALHLDALDPAPDHTLASWECFVLFDLHSLGNGSARAVFRDGVELLLRLVRLFLERVLYHDRLLALHDQWAHSDGGGDLYRDEAPADENGAARPADPAVQRRRETEEEARHRALNWLDSRLRPEGDASTFAGGLAQHQGEAEPGEGDVIDIGRCWYTTDRSVADLLWVKHRWRLFDGREVMLDAGISRPVAERARRLSAGSTALEPGREKHRVHLSDTAHALADGTVWGASRAVWRVEGEERKPHSSQPGGGDADLLADHETFAAFAVDAWHALGPLVRKLHAASEVTTDEESGRYTLAGYLASFVQAIPSLRSHDGGDSAHLLSSPIDVLLRRRGDAASKNLLLAVLLAACGVPSGLFVSREEKRSLVAAALPEPVAVQTRTVAAHRDSAGRFTSADDAAGEPERYARQAAAGREMDELLVAWSGTVGLAAPPPLWSELPARAERIAGEEGGAAGDVGDAGDAREPPGGSLLFVPIDANLRWPPGSASVTRPESWIFLPLTSVYAHRRPAVAAAARPGEEEARER